MSGAEQKYGTIGTSFLETTCADVFEVVCAPGEIDLLFGMVRGVDAGQEFRVSADLANRVILSPYATKRLSASLNQLLKDYETAFGDIVNHVPTTSIHTKASSLKAAPLRYTTDRTAAKAQFLMQLIDNLGVEYGLERSFKISERSLLQNRFILGFKKNGLSGNPDEILLPIYKRMEMPGRFVDECRRLLPQTEFVHFGFEEKDDRCLYKAYLEFKTNLKFGLDGAKVKQDPFLVFLGFKWDPFDTGACAVTRYTCYPLLPLDDIQERLFCLYERNPAYKSFETARTILHETVKVISNNKIIYEEVSEDENPRKSFDMNLYGANLRIRDIYPFLMDIGRHYSLPEDEFVPLCDSIIDKSFGHLSGGIDREGKDFLTVYYGVEGVEK